MTRRRRGKDAEITRPRQNRDGAPRALPPRSMLAERQWNSLKSSRLSVTLFREPAARTRRVFLEYPSIRFDLSDVEDVVRQLILAAGLSLAVGLAIGAQTQSQAQQAPQPPAAG